MIVQTPPPEDSRQENGEQNITASADKPRTTRKPAITSSASHISTAQIALVLLMAIFLWQWLAGHRAIDDMQQQLTKKFADMDGGSKANQILLAQNQHQVHELSAQVAALESRYTEAQNQRATLEALYADMSVSRDEAALAEVEQMLLIAAQQLQLSANVKVALITMQSADARLQRMNRPAFTGLRKSISLDIEKLRSLPNVDIAGVSIQLDNLMASVDGLPLAYQQRPAPERTVQAAPPKGETLWQKLLREVWDEIRQLVRIENTGKTEIPLLPPNQEFFLRENLKLRLMSARLALVSRDEESFRHDLKTAQLWIARYFDVKSNDALRMLSSLKILAASTIRIELPDISTSLNAVRNYRLTHENEPRASFDTRHKKPQ